MDKLASVLLFCMFLTPLITVPLVWKYSSQKKYVRVIIGVLLAIVLSCLLFYAAYSIAFRNGMGRIM